MKRLVVVMMAIFFGLFGLCGCSSDQTAKKNTDAVKRAVTDGHVVVESKADGVDAAAQGQVKVLNAVKIADFKAGMREHKKVALKLTYFNTKKDSVTSELKFNGKSVTFHNQFEGYHAKNGTYQCQNLLVVPGTQVWQVSLSDCKMKAAKSGQELFILFVPKDDQWDQAFREASRIN
ncbi:hypothetical protein ACFO4N_01865 [Camelliibacillus cellulosilyticus]|uniref:DUF4352 domain-containing protein n=1 Tax=Camelliibacillus cellulosilyticus TaxID=2174486 RepID=A0ABV9GK30_9BACL